MCKLSHYFSWLGSCRMVHMYVGTLGLAPREMRHGDGARQNDHLPPKMKFPPSHTTSLSYTQLFTTDMPHFRPLMLLANRLSSIQSILSFERWEGYHHFEDEKVRSQCQSFVSNDVCIFVTHTSIRFRILPLSRVSVELQYSQRFLAWTLVPMLSYFSYSSSCSWV